MHSLQKSISMVDKFINEITYTEYDDKSVTSELTDTEREIYPEVLDINHSAPLVMPHSSTLHCIQRAKIVDLSSSMHRKTVLSRTNSIQHLPMNRSQSLAVLGRNRSNFGSKTSVMRSGSLAFSNENLKFMDEDVELKSNNKSLKFKTAPLKVENDISKTRMYATEYGYYKKRPDSLQLSSRRSWKNFFLTLN